jgi:hypothetical protein
MLARLSRFLRDVSYFPTQVELSTLVRKRCPERPPLDEDALDEPDERPGPRTAPMPGRSQRQVTFATRIGEASEARARGRRPIALVAGLAVAALVVGGGIALRARRRGPPPVTPPTVMATPMASAGQATTTGQATSAAQAVEPAAPAPVGAPSAKVVRPVARKRAAPVGRGQLTLNALPWAHVTIDGDKAPDTPLVKLALPAGPHVVKLVSPPTGREFKLTVTIEPDQEIRRVVDLRGEPSVSE